MKKQLFVIFLFLPLLLLSCFLLKYASRIQTMRSIHRLTDYEDYNLYSMHLHYDYDLDRILSNEIRTDQDYIDSVLSEVLPGLPIRIQVPSFGCSAFSAVDADGKWVMGRNYDFKLDTSAVLVYAEPENGYRSVSFAALNNLNADIPDAGVKERLACLLSPFAILDGMNEKGVSMAVLTLDSEPTRQDNGRSDLPTALAIRLVLDRAATTEEAIALLSQYDMYATSGRDYHFYISDASGNGVAVEYDPLSETREMVVTPMAGITNFYGMYEELVEPNQKNGVYGHGKERYLSIMNILEKNRDSVDQAILWEALRSAAQLPNPEDVTSNTQWSILYNNTDLSVQFVLRRNWEDVVEIFLS